MSKRVIPSIAVTAFVLAAGASAFAADMPVKAPPSPPPPAPPSWTGWYVGGNVGASFARVKTDFDVAPVTVTTTIVTSTFTSPSLAGSNISHPSGFMGGADIGYNWQYSPLIVVGVEADFQGALERENDLYQVGNFSGTASGVALAVTGSALADYQTKIDWFGTVRGRIGYLWGDGAVLTYVTGGLAYGRVDLEGTNVVSGTIGGTPFSITSAIGHSQVNAGWVAGFGTEGKIGLSNWTFKIESLYVDLSSLNDTDAVAPVVSTVTGGQTFTHTHFADGIVRLGLNYQFH